jgi:hypothetical protein
MPLTLELIAFQTLAAPKVDGLRIRRFLVKGVAIAGRAIYITGTPTLRYHACYLCRTPVGSSAGDLALEGINQVNRMGYSGLPDFFRQISEIGIHYNPHFSYPSR